MTSDFTELARFADDANDPHGDEATLHQLANQGVDLSEPTNFRHYLSFADETDATMAGQALANDLGYRVRAFAPQAAEQLWTLIAETEREPSLDKVDRMRRVMQTAAVRFNGRYDGWEAAVQRPDQAK